MSEFKPGDIIDVTTKGLRVVREGSDEFGMFLEVVIDVNGKPRDGRVYPDGPSTITRAAPFGWPPRPGDVWRDHEKVLWFTVSDGPNESGEIVTMVPANRYRLHNAAPDLLAETRGPLVLMRREDPS